MSRIIANAYRHTGASADAITLDSSGNVTFPANATCSGTATGFGKILQVVSTQKSDVFTWGTTGDVAITGMTVSITPSSNASKVLVQVQIGASGVYNDAFPIFWQLYKGGSQISGAKGSGTSGTTVKCASYTKNYVYYVGTSTSFSFLDSPATTSATTYQLYGQRHSSSGTAYFNATAQQVNERYAETISTITAMEVGA